MVDRSAITDIRARLAAVGLLAAEGAMQPAVGRWARRVAAAASRRCASGGGHPSECHALGVAALGVAVAEAARRDVAYVEERPETLVRPDVLLDLGAGDCDDTSALVLAALLRLGVAPDRLAVMAGLDRRGPLWHMWPALDHGGWVHLDASTHLTEPGRQSPADVGGLEPVVTYRLPPAAASGAARAAGLHHARAAGDGGGGEAAAVAAAAEELGILDAIGGALEDVWNWMERGVESVLSPKTQRYRDQRGSLTRQVDLWHQAAAAALDLVTDKTASPTRRKVAWPQAIEWLKQAGPGPGREDGGLIRHPTYLARMGDELLGPVMSPGAYSVPDGATRSAHAQAETHRGLLAFAADVARGAARGAASEAVGAARAYAAQTQTPPGSPLFAAPPPGASGGLGGVGLLALALPLGLALFGGAGAPLVAAGALGAYGMGRRRAGALDGGELARLLGLLPALQAQLGMGPNQYVWLQASVTRVPGWVRGLLGEPTVPAELEAEWRALSEAERAVLAGIVQLAGAVVHAEAFDQTPAERAAAREYARRQAERAGQRTDPDRGSALSLDSWGDARDILDRQDAGTSIVEAIVWGAGALAGLLVLLAALRR